MAEIVDLLAVEASLVLLASVVLEIALVRGSRIVLILFYFCLQQALRVLDSKLSLILLVICLLQVEAGAM